MEAVVLVAVLTLSLAIAAAAAWAGLSLAMSLITRASTWTAAPDAAPVWTDAGAREEHAPARQPLAA